MNRWKNLAGVIEAEKRCQFALLNDVAEEMLSCAVCCNSRRQDDSGAPICREQLVDGFGEHRVGIDVARGGEREAFALAEKLAGAIGSMNGGDELRVKRWILIAEF